MWDLVHQQNPGMRAAGRMPGTRKLREVSGVMRQQRATFASRIRKMKFVRRSEVSCFTSRQTVNTMLGKNTRQDNRYRFVEIEPHCAVLGERPGSSASCSAISRSMASRWS